MLMAVVAVLGVLVAAWTLIGDVDRVVVRALAMRHRVWLSIWGVFALAFVLLVPFAEAWVFNRYPPTEAGKALTLGLESLLLVMVTAASLWPLRWAILPFGKVSWDLDLVEAATGRIQELVRQGKASTAAAVVARFAQLADRPKRVDGGLDAYEKLLDWCLKHDSFVEAMVREQTDVIAKLIRAHDSFLKPHAYGLVYRIFSAVGSPLRSEQARRRAEPDTEAIARNTVDGGVLDALVKDTTVCCEWLPWMPVYEVMVQELKRRSEKVGQREYEQEIHRRHLKYGPGDLVADGIELLGMWANVPFKDAMALDSLTRCFRYLAISLTRTLEAYGRTTVDANQEDYQSYFRSMCDTLRIALLEAARQDAAHVQDSRNQVLAYSFVVTLSHVYAERLQKVVVTQYPIENTTDDLKSIFDELQNSGFAGTAEGLVIRVVSTTTGPHRPVILEELGKIAMYGKDCTSVDWFKKKMCPPQSDL